MADRGITSGRIEAGSVVSGDIVLATDKLPAVKRQRSAEQRKPAGFTWNPSLIEFSFGDTAVSWADRLKIYDNDVSSILSKIDDAITDLKIEGELAKLTQVVHIRRAHLSIGTSAWPQIEA